MDAVLGILSVNRGRRPLHRDEPDVNCTTTLIRGVTEGGGSLQMEAHFAGIDGNSVYALTSGVGVAIRVIKRPSGIQKPILTSPGPTHVPRYGVMYVDIPETRGAFPLTKHCD